MTINQLQWVWNGWSGAPGYTSIYVQGSDPVAVNDVAHAFDTFLQGVKGLFPPNISATGPATYRIINETNGNLVGESALLVPVPNMTGTGGAGMAAPAGLSIEWLTSVPATSRLVKGRTYLVPISSAVYQADGTLVEVNRTDTQTKAQAFVDTAGGLFVIWRRPVDGAGGSVAEVEAARVNDRVAILRSRRS